jgi:hypothetical protein
MEIGDAVAIEDFRSRHSRFFERSASLEQTIAAAFDHAVRTDNRADVVISLLGARCVTDFREILVLTANGFGWGATAHLRGMFERVVTAAYIHENQSAAIDFVEYEFIRRWKGLQAIERTFGLPQDLQEKKADVIQNYQRIRERFLVPACDTCKTTRLNHTWSRLDVVAMAGQIRKTKLASLVVPAYYLPLAQSHSTFASISNRIREVEAGVFAADQSAARPEADRTLEYAHLLLLNMLIVQHEHFQLQDLGPFMDQAFEHFRYAWHHGNGALPTS